MTLLVPLDENARSQICPAFVSSVDNPATLSSKIIKAILKARRIAVVCGAGISVQAGIPDFRSADGLFQSIRKENPRESLSSGKDLFDASVFNSEHTTALFCQMMARLSQLSSDATPTPFHNVLRELDKRGKLLRVYTQNIDALEEKAGMSFGLPDHNSSRARGKSKATKRASQIGEGSYLLEESSSMDLSSQSAPAEQASVVLPLPSSSSGQTPRCIPLHGTLRTMHCISCTHTFPLSDHLSPLLAGVPPDCPECTVLEATRTLVGKRPRGVGKLRPSVVLYNEDHRDGEDVGAVVRRDLTGSAKGKGRGGADVLIVVGTSLRVPGTKRIVREFSKAVKARETARAERAHEVALAKLAPLPTPIQTPTPSPSPSPRRTPAGDDEAASSVALPPEERSITTIYVNLDFPVPTREWDGVFDVWVQGDAQVFAGMVQEEMMREEKERTEKAEREERAKEERREREDRRKREKEEKEADKAEKERRTAAKLEIGLGKGKKRAAPVVEDARSAKRRRVTLIVRDSSTSSFPAVSSSSLLRKRSSSKSEKASESKLKVAMVSSTGVSPSAMSKTKPVDPSPNSKRRSLPMSGAKRVRAVPEVVITVPPPHSSDPSDSLMQGNVKSGQLVSPLDILADAAASMSRVRLASPTGSGDFNFDSSPSPCPCPYPDSLHCDCRTRVHYHSTPQSRSRNTHGAHDDDDLFSNASFDSPFSRASTLTPISSPYLSDAPPIGAKKARVSDTPLTPQSVPKRARRETRSISHPSHSIAETARTSVKKDDATLTAASSSKRERVRGRTPRAPRKRAGRRREKKKNLDLDPAPAVVGGRVFHSYDPDHTLISDSDSEPGTLHGRR